MNPVQWFEIPATDLARAKSFYQAVFGVELTHLDMGPAAMEMFPAAPDVPGSGGALIVTEGYTPSHAGTMVYFSVDDIEGTLVAAHDHGGTTLVPKLDIGEFGFVAHFQDTEGNRVGLHSRT